MIALLAFENDHLSHSVLGDKYKLLRGTNECIPLYTPEEFIIPPKELVTIDFQVVATILNLNTYNRIQEEMPTELSNASILSKCPFVVSIVELDEYIMSQVILWDDLLNSIKVHIFNYSNNEITISQYRHLFNIFAKLPVNGRIPPLQFKMVSRDDCVFAQGSRFNHLIQDSTHLIYPYKNVFKIYPLYDRIAELYQPYDFVSSIILYCPDDIIIEPSRSRIINLEIYVSLHQIGTTILNILPFSIIGHNPLHKNKKIISSPQLYSIVEESPFQLVRVTLQNHTNEAVTIPYGTPVAEMVPADIEYVSSKIVSDTSFP